MGSGGQVIDDMVATPDVSVEQDQQTPLTAPTGGLLDTPPAPQCDSPSGVCRPIKVSEHLVLQVEPKDVPVVFIMGTAQRPPCPLCRSARADHPIRVQHGLGAHPHRGHQTEAVMHPLGIEGIGPSQCVNALPALASGPGVVRQGVVSHDDPVAQECILRQQDVKRPPAGPRNPGGQCRRDVSAMVVGQRIEMNENTGGGAVPVVIAPQEARLHHLNPVDGAPLPQDGSAAHRSSGHG